MIRPRTLAYELLWLLLAVSLGALYGFSASRPGLWAVVTGIFYLLVGRLTARYRTGRWLGTVADMSEGSV